MRLLVLLFMIWLAPFMILLLYQKGIKQDIAELKEQKKKEPKKIDTKRRHASIQTNTYNSILDSRGNKKAYDVFKNKNGLYEPLQPHQGIKIEQQKEE